MVEAATRCSTKSEGRGSVLERGFRRSRPLGPCTRPGGIDGGVEEEAGPEVAAWSSSEVLEAERRVAVREPEVGERRMSSATSFAGGDEPSETPERFILSETAKSDKQVAM